ncbi:NAD(P)-binding domain-containing protein [Kitasatospora kifunensis]|uniref:3-hydroxyisobutyrate dehydrogenase-like beta-hydroxyacid dehydrogenase n=1 Tax=Kitasatospora kifunensis TaxID=58351 RepID=A0A7W7VXW4_KITKI|nr:NAD(P)-binding domain-containing protein [Kitasatospora kifunensis]MBB4926398.1 3-hydroxyisobutyrate dehydrogenase-like beta-hydroxyacid dehydrogenase [Kitasatospora kifunensis]
MTPAPTRAPRPATTIVVAGYGVMTAGILPHLAALPDTRVTLTSRHLTKAPDATIPLIAPAAIVAQHPDVILGCFEDDARSHAFWSHEHVVAAVTEHRPACIEMSTISPERAEEWHHEITALGGLPWECPVTGSRPGAKAGTLSAFVHAPAAHPAANRVLAAFTRNRYPFTRPGNPARFKLIFNAWGASLLHAAGVFARCLPVHLGPDYLVAARIVTSDGWMATLAGQKLPRIETGAYTDPDFAVHHMVKDLVYARDLLGDLPLVTAALEAFAAAEKRHGPYADFTAVADTTTGGTP